MDLDAGSLRGTIPIELVKLTKLEVLSLAANRLSGPIPPELTQLTELTYLRLHDNYLSGPIPPELGQMAGLQNLLLGFNRLSGPIPSELGNLGSLKRLELYANDFVGQIPPELGRLRELVTLWLSYNDLSGPIPPELGDLGRLENLGLHGIALTGPIPPELGNLTELLALELYDNDFSGSIPPELGNLKQLERLRLSNNGLSGTIPPQLASLSQLKELDLGNNDLSGPIPPELGNLGRLEGLGLHNNNLSGPIPPELGNLTELVDLVLFNNDLSGSIPPELGQLHQLQRLLLHSNVLSGSIPPELGNLTEIISFQLERNRLSGTIPQELKRLTRLRALFLNHNQLSGPVPNLTGLQNLWFLHLQVNQFRFADLLPIASLSRLVRFSYEPQGPIDTQLSCTALGYALTTPAKAEGNLYKWYRNGRPIPGEQSDTLRLTTVSDQDEYHATITNSALPDLTVYSRIVSTRGAVPCMPQDHANIADSTLLVDFYNRTQGSLLWYNHTGWLEEPVAQWYGITLDASGRVTHINLPSNNLVGQLPLSQLDQLPHLQHLDVSSNKLSGTIPKGLGSLTQLEYLDLSHNSLAGELPKELAGQAPLKMLDVGDNQLVGAIPIEFSQITTLQKLSLIYNQLSGPTPDFTGLDQLDSLDVSWNAFLFMDLLPNASLTRLDDFVYAPQDSIETLLSRTASGFALTTAAKAVGNRYQWYRDDLLISGPQSDTLHVSATSDPAQYHVAITNDRLPDLTLVSRKKGVHDGLTLTEADIPDDFLLHQSYPNPFAEATTVAFELGTPEHVRIVVYDLLGKAVATIADRRFAAGAHRVEFTGDHLASGQYVYRMEAGTYRATRFMSVVR